MGNARGANAANSLSTEQRRLSVNLSPKVAAALEDVTKEQEITVTEAIRRGISWLKLVQDLEARGGRVLIDDPGKPLQVVMSRLSY